MKNKVDVARVVLEGLVSIALGLAAESIIGGFKQRMKKDAPEKTLVADLTVEELRQILREEA